MVKTIRQTSISLGDWQSQKLCTAAYRRRKKCKLNADFSYHVTRLSLFITFQRLVNFGLSRLL